ncbi:MAG: hypothetical protein V4722_24170 [Bacteroidota bacterium]
MEQHFTGEFSDEPIDLNAPDAHGEFPIMSAMDDLDLLRHVIASGANVNIDIGQGWTPLHCAFDDAIDGMVQSDSGEPDGRVMKEMKILLENGADPTIKNAEGKTALDALNTYTNSITGFNVLKDMFRNLIPDIDNMVSFDETATYQGH